MANGVEYPRNKIICPSSLIYECSIKIMEFDFFQIRCFLLYMDWQDLAAWFGFEDLQAPLKERISSGHLGEALNSWYASQNTPQFFLSSE